MKKPDKIIREEVVFEGKIFEIVHRHFSGSKRMVEVARRAPGVRLIITKGSKMLITKEFRYELNDYDYRLPGGKVFDTLNEYRYALGKKRNMIECAIAAAKKECLEETGLIAKRIKLFHVSKAGLTVNWDLFYFIIDEFDKNKHGQQLEHHEIIYPEWKTFKEVKQLCLKNQIKEDRTVGMLLKFLLKNKANQALAFILFILNMFSLSISSNLNWINPFCLSRLGITTNSRALTLLFVFSISLSSFLIEVSTSAANIIFSTTLS